MGNYLSPERQRFLTNALLRGTPQRAISDNLEVDRKTVARHARWLGRTARYLLGQQRDLRLQHFQMDEFYTHVLAKRDQADDIESHSVLVGMFAHFLSVEADSGFIVNQLAAPSNGEAYTRAFLEDFDKRLLRNPDGSYVLKPEVITDGFGSYWPIIKDGFPDWSYAQFVKKKTNTTKDGKETKKMMFGGIERRILRGPIRDPLGFNTELVEAVNGSARSKNMRAHKKSKAFSKRFAQHREQFALWAWAYNYAAVQERRKATPAMVAGVDHRLWTAKELILAANEYREMLGDVASLDEDDLSDLGFEVPAVDFSDPNLVWVYHSLVQKATKLHFPSCRWCNYGAGVKGQPGASGVWLPHRTYAEARAYGERVTPDRVTDCRDCFGERNYFRGRF